MREATVSVLAYVVLAALFGVGVWLVYGQQYGAEFFAGYITELSLSVDNLFVFVVIMSAFAVPREHQLKVLQLGIVGALVLRGIFIAVGAVLLGYFTWLFFVFGAFLLWTAWKLASGHGTVSLIVIGVTLLLTVVASLAKVRRHPEVLTTHDVTGHHHSQGTELEELRRHGRHPHPATADAATDPPPSTGLESRPESH